MENTPIQNSAPVPAPGRGGLYLGGGSTTLAVLVAILSQSKELGEFAAVLNGPMGMAILGILGVISISGFYFHVLVNPLRTENAQLKQEVARVRQSLVDEREKLRDKYEKEVADIRQEMNAMQNRITELSTELAASKATLKMLQEGKDQ